MTKRTGPTNPVLRKLARKLRAKSKELDVPLWGDVAEKLLKSRRSRPEVNISQLNRFTEKGDTILVPGKVLAAGKLENPLKIAAFKFSNRAERKIKSAGGETMKIGELLEENPEGKGITIME
ncbi:MAG: 50S ribosomal protein L18e [Hadesarchaea archaeon]|nr:50S ribosomal protein L18e [Hadesarchaea archaeon]